MEEGKLIHEIHLGEHEVMGKVFKSIGSALAIALLIGFMLTGSIVMSIWGKSPFIGNLMFGIFSFFSVWLVLRFFIRSSL